MTPPDLPSRRCALRLLLSGLALAALPLGGERPWDAPMAWAGDDDRDDEDDRDDDDDDDSSGPGSGDHRDDEEDRDDDFDDDDRDDDDRGDDDRDDERDDDRDRDERDADDSRDGSGRGRDRRHLPRDITVLYPDGWTERIVEGRYELLDHQSRLVVRRAATAEDFGRMIALR